MYKVARSSYLFSFHLKFIIFVTVFSTQYEMLIQIQTSL